MKGQGEWRWHAGWGVLTRLGAVVSQILSGDHSLLLICSSESCNLGVDVGIRIVLFIPGMD